MILRRACTLLLEPRGSKLPSRVLLVLASPRSGSTWLSDAIRCHPSIDYHPRATVYRALKLTGGRYPRDLSNGPDGKREIECTPGGWVRIPVFATPLGQEPPDRFKEQSFAIEKCHPEFYGFDNDCFLERIGEHEQRGVQFKMIYHVRDPLASLVSFARYQRRSPDWYPNLGGQALVAFMCRTYDSIVAAARARSGLVLDYSDVVKDLSAVLRRIYHLVWPDLTQEEEGFCDLISREAPEVTSRARRVLTRSAFLGKTAGAVSGGDKGDESVFRRWGHDLEQCYANYDALMNLRKG